MYEFAILGLALLGFVAVSLHRIADSLAEITKLGVVAVVRGHLGTNGQAPVTVVVKTEEGGPV